MESLSPVSRVSAMLASCKTLPTRGTKRALEYLSAADFSGEISYAPVTESLSLAPNVGSRLSG